MPVNILPMPFLPRKNSLLTNSRFSVPPALRLYMVDKKFFNHYPYHFSEKQEKYRNFFEKGIDFMGKLRYNWTVHEQNMEQEV